MNLLERYILKIAFGAFLSCLLALTAVIWITQALKQLDLLTGKGQTILMFLTVTGLSLPTLVTVISPVALFIATIYTLNKLNGDSELIVMSAAGMPPQRLLRPFLGLAALACAARRDHDHLRHAGELPGTARPDHQDPGRFRRQHRQGRPVHRARQRRHLPLPRALRRRRCSESSCRTGARRTASSSTSPSAARPSRRTGRAISCSRRAAFTGKQPNSRDSSIVALRALRDRSRRLQPGREARSSTSRASARTTQLSVPGPAGALLQDAGGPLPGRAARPALGLALSARHDVIAFAALGDARTTRQGRGTAIAAAVVAVVVLRIIGFAASSAAVRSPCRADRRSTARRLPSIVVGARSSPSRVRACAPGRARSDAVPISASVDAAPAGPAEGLRPC